MKVQKISGQKSRNNFVGILEELSFHKDILKLTDLFESVNLRQNASFNCFEHKAKFIFAIP